MNTLPKTHNFISIPGLGGSGPLHWQSIWSNYQSDLITVKQDEWNSPTKDKWVDRLIETVEEHSDKPIILVAHSLAVVTVLFAAAERGMRVAGAFLVAPADSEVANFPAGPKHFSPIPRNVLPFPSMVVGSENDPWCSIEKAKKMANWTQSKFVNIGKKGHVTSADGVEMWETGFQLLLDFTSLC